MLRDDVELAKEDLYDLMIRLTTIASEPEVKRINLKDGDFTESASSFLDMFLPRARLAHSRLIRIAEALPKPRRKKKQ